MSINRMPRSVLVTGATGNIGAKLVEALALTPWCERIIGIDKITDGHCFSPAAKQKLNLIGADLSVSDLAWTGGFQDIDAVIHLASANPLPDSGWEDALVSSDMTLNVLRASIDHKVKRLIFASSNHAMGAYKDEPLATLVGPGLLTTDLASAPGTRWFNGTQHIHSLAYGKSKVLGEKICETMALASRGAMSCVSVRIGWILPGENNPRDITYAGAPVATELHPIYDMDAVRNLRWFREMWLSNDDMKLLFLAALTADSLHWPSPVLVVNGISANFGSVWDLENARSYLGYHPKDDVYRHIG